MPRQCWAASLGGCNRISGEHVIPRAVLEASGQRSVSTEGLARMPTGTVGTSAMTANILCNHHNSLLSPLDETLAALQRWQVAMGKPGAQHELRLHGPRLERAVLKLFLGTLASGWGAAAPTLRQFDLEVVRSVFGTTPVPMGCGLSVGHNTWNSRQRSMEVAVSTLNSSMADGTVQPQCVVVVLNGLPLLFSTSQTLLADIRSFKPKVDFGQGLALDLAAMEFQYHPSTFICDMNGQNYRLLLDWPT